MMLHLPPMTQYDAAATPMFASFSSSPTCILTQSKGQVDLTAVNPRNNSGAQASRSSTSPIWTVPTPTR